MPVSAAVAAIGRILRLSPGVDGPVLPLAPDQEMVELYAAVPELKGDFGSPFCYELASQFLPSLVETVVATHFQPSVVQDAHSSWIHYCIWLQRAMDVLGDRFVRLHPDQAVKLYLYLLDIAAGLTEHDLETAPSSIPEIVNFALSVTFSCIIAAYPHSRVPVPSLSHEQQGRLGRFLAATGADDIPSLVERYAELNSRDMDAAREMLSREGAKFLWWGCEWARGDSATRSLTCVSFEDGVEMDACGRCLNVRYCSLDHQKLHWKEHKKFCFKPTW